MTSIFKVESKYGKKFLFLDTLEEYKAYALRSAMQSLFIARGKDYDVSRIGHHDINDENSVRVTSVSQLMQWAAFVVLSHEEPVYTTYETETHLWSLMIPDTLKTHISIENDVYTQDCYRNIFTISNDSNMFHVDKDAIAEWVLRRLNESNLRDGGNVHDTEDYKPIVYTSKFKLKVVRRKHNSGYLAGYDEFRFYRVAEHKEIDHYKTVAD